MPEKEETEENSPKKEKTSKNKLSNMKDFLGKHKKAVIAVVIALAIFALFGGYRLWLNLHFLITEDLSISLNPNDISLSVLYNETPGVTFNVEVKNSFFCDSRCSYEFYDISSSRLIEEGYSVGSGTQKRFSKGYNLSIDSVGSGQKIYRFSVACNNIRTWYCLTDELKRQKASFVTLNYDLSAYERFLKSSLKEDLEKVLKRISEIDIGIQELNGQFFELAFNINLNEISREKDILNQKYSSIVLETENLRRVWSSQNYPYLSELYGQVYEARLQEISEELGSVSSRMQSVLEMHNTLAEEADEIEANLRELNQTLLFGLRPGSGKILEEHNSALRAVEKIKNEIRQNTFSNYSYVEKSINEAEKSFSGITARSKDRFIEAYTAGFYYSALEEDILCDIKGICLDRRNLSSIKDEFFDVDDGKIASFCSSFNEIKGLQSIENNISGNLMKNYVNMREVIAIAEKIKNKKIGMIKNRHYNEIKSLSPGSQNQNFSLNMLLGMLSAYNETPLIEDSDYGEFSESEILSLISLNLTNQSIKYYNDYCAITPELNLSEYYGNRTSIGKVPIPEKKNFSSRIDVSLSDNYPVCCIFGECRPCCQEESCRKDPALYPILFIHGHALNSDNSPDYSLDAFNKLISRLEEDGYLSAGTITPVSNYSEVNRGEWGLSSKPISVKGSYYLVSYYDIGGYVVSQQKSENIETYALRLKELVDLLKFRTGREKVIIFSNSMGGLVARSYMQIFGEQSVHKLIMFGTPNKGISGAVSGFCPILGENKECGDMAKDSIFIKKLNDPSKTPKSAKLYVVVGTGCNTGGEDGDGIVTRANAELPYAENFYVNGSCSSLKVLHEQLLDIGKFPQIYDFIKKDLRQ